MSKAQIILSTLAVVLVIALFLLPKAVVDNTETSNVEDPDNSQNPGREATNTPAPSENNAHNAEVPREAQELLTNLRESIEHSEDNEKIAIFADSLAGLYKSYNQLDSAAKYMAIAAERSPSKERVTKAGDYYYEAFTYAVDPEKSQRTAEMARKYYNEVITSGSKEEELDAKAKIAMTYIASSNPMQGIGLLREILEEDPEHEGALFNLGILSMQSSQYDKAVERFERLVSLYPENLEAQFYLGVSYAEAGKKGKARDQLNKVKELDNDPEVQAAVDGYLEEIK